MIFQKNHEPQQTSNAESAAERTSNAATHIGKTLLEKVIANPSLAQSESAPTQNQESNFIGAMPEHLRPDSELPTEHVTVMGQPEQVADVADPRRVPGHPANENNDALKAAADDIRNTPINNTL